MKDEFLKELKDRLTELNDSDVDDTIAYFNELIDDKMAEGYSEEEVINDLGKPQDVAITLAGEEKKVDHFSNEIVDIDNENNVRHVFSGRHLESISIDNVSINIIVRQNDIDEIVFEYPRSDEYHFNVSYEDGVLDIEFKTDGFGRFMKNGIPASGDAILYVPDKNYDSLDIDNVSGSIIISNQKTDSLDVENVSGMIEINEVKCDSIDVETVSGSCHMHDISCDSISAESVSGGIEIIDMECDDINIESVSGNIELEIKGDPSDYDIDIDKMFGSVSIEGNGGASLEIETVSGSISYKFI